MLVNVHDIVLLSVYPAALRILDNSTSIAQYRTAASKFFSRLIK